MSKLQVDTIVDKEDKSAPTLSKGAIVTGVTTSTSFAGALTGDVTGNVTGNQSGGSINATTGDFSSKVTVSTDINVSGTSTVGVLTATSAVVGSAVTSNADGIVAAGIVTAGTCFKTGDGVFGAGIGATITGAGDAVFAGVCTASSFNTTVASSAQLNITGITTTTQVLPAADATHDLGSSSARWANLYVADMNFSNKGLSNDVDGTWGTYTIQEGRDDLFLINNRSGKKYKFNLTEVQ